MTRAELNALKKRAIERNQKAGDMDVVVAQIMELPYGQVKKVLTDDVLAVLAKYGYPEEAKK